MYLSRPEVSAGPRGRAVREHVAGQRPHAQVGGRVDREERALLQKRAVSGGFQTPLSFCRDPWAALKFPCSRDRVTWKYAMALRARAAQTMRQARKVCLPRACLRLQTLRQARLGNQLQRIITGASTGSIARGPVHRYKKKRALQISHSRMLPVVPATGSGPS